METEACPLARRQLRLLIANHLQIIVKQEHRNTFNKLRTWKKKLGQNINKQTRHLEISE